MRLKINFLLQDKSFIPYNYNYQLHSAIYNTLNKAEPLFSDFLHNEGYHNDLRVFKFFTFSKLLLDNFTTIHKDQHGFRNVKKASLILSTNVDRIFENIVLGIFTDNILVLNFKTHTLKMMISEVEVLPEIEYQNRMTFSCLSPISMSTMQEIDGKLQQHFLDYMNPEERDHFKINLYNNLCQKYKTIFSENWNQPILFNFSFDPNYIVKAGGRISKLIHFKNNEKIKCFEGPFTIETYPELIKIGYECGFGDKNSAGMGCVDLLRRQDEK